MPQYQGVWTLEAQAQAQSNQQWVTDPNFKNTTLLLQADGTGSGSQNQTFLDSSTNNFFITRNGNTTQGSFSPFSQAPGYWSNYFDGNNSCDLQTPSNAAFGYGTGDFSLEAWVYQQTNANARIIDHTNDGFNFGLKSSGVVTLFAGGTSYDTPTSSFSLNTWTHICCTRQSSTLRIFVNGVLKYNTTLTASKPDSAVNIGSNPGGGGETLNGYISNIRIVKGGVPSAYSTSSTTNGTVVFTPSNIPFSASDSLTAGSLSLLTCQSNRFVDNSANAFAISVTAGTPTVQTFSPFAPALQWTPDVVGGSAYYDGSGDYLTGPSASGGDFSTGNFTISCWFYPTTLSGGTNYGLMSYADTGGWNGWQLQARGTQRDILFEFLTGSAGASQITGGSIALNAWNYVAIVRSGSTVSMYVNSTTAATSTTNSTAYGAATSRVIVGSDRTLGSSFIGYISNSKLVKQANAPASIPTAPDTATTNTSFLLNYTNAGIYDGKMGTSWETVNSAQVSTNPVKVGSGSIYFNGVASQRLLPSQLYPQLTFGTGDFTIECWLYIIGKNATTVGGIIDYRPGVNGTYVNWVVDFGGYSTGTATAPKLVLYADSAVFSSSNVISISQWNHVALCRANGITRMFINGVLASTPVADTKNYASGGSAGNYRPTIGCTDGGDSMYGYMDDFRISRFARYIANFTPPQQALPRQ